MSMRNITTFHALPCLSQNITLTHPPSLFLSLSSLPSPSSSLETVDKLLAAGARTDARDKDGWTPLHFAARFNNVEMLDSLLAVCFDPQSLHRHQRDGFA
jgi:hypothetical protein